MLYNFAPLQSGPLAKRRKVRRACEFCREHRVRCDGMLPCSQCMANKVKCVKPNPLHLLSAPRSARPQHIRPSVLSCTPTPQSVASPALVDLPRDPTHVVARHPDCLTGFISRINSFCSVVSQISTQTSPDSNVVISAETSYSTPDLIQDAEQTAARPSPSDLPDLRERLSEIFWARYLPLIPILTQTDVLDVKPDRKREPLQNALMAYCLQSIFHAGLHDRLLGISAGISHAQEPSSDKRQSPLVALFVSYFQKALAANSHYLLYAEPSVSDVQRHILMALFLLNSGEVLAAYNIIGAAVRLAQSLDLHKLPTPPVMAKEADIWGRVWWMLVHLDFRCSRYLGKPMAVSLRDTALPLPNYHPSVDQKTSELVFHSATITLTVVGKGVAESLAARHDKINGNNFVPQIELSAEHLTHEIGPLFEWRDLIVKVDPFKNLMLDGSVNHPQTHPAEGRFQYRDDAWVYDQPFTRTLEQTLLELQFHDIVIWFHRPFIQFPNHGLVPQRSPRADIHATTALQHALKVTEIVHRRMLNHDALHGCSDVYQYVWNAVLTLIGFLLAYPLCYWCPVARKHLELSCQVFDSAKTSNPCASRATHLTRYLLGRVDALIEVLNAQASASNSHAHSPAREKVAESRDRVELEQFSEPDLPTSGADALWSWAETVDPKAWSGYCDEINDLLTAFPEIPPGTDYFPL
ncbi:hypothetical protein N7466_006578 [Penicillium verhagenii]|uniref:uncharacterized protein n=1 Tax=Penicillium verhagenii TaxID=1562060 RepID=UPI002545A77F|nr:uncharacterized protein N7466_006578 [Penicillium verhagenii]KAJ5931085.1 hypothetical protein N7466_006578 [Penicillium verhagenii]